MAETILSPGVLARENDSSAVQEQPITVGAAIVGPTSKGPVEIPTVVTSYTQFKSIFGGAVESGSSDYSYFTGISAYNYFQNGGESLLVTRVTSGSFTPAESTLIKSNISDGVLATDLGALDSAVQSGFNILTSASSGLSTDANELLSSIVSGFNITASVSSPLLTATNALSSSIASGFNITSSVGNGPGTVTGIALPGGVAGTGATASISYATSESISSITVTFPGNGYVNKETITIPSASAGANLPGGSDIVITLDSADLAFNDNGPGTRTGVALGGSLSGTGATADITFATSQSISAITVTVPGNSYTNTETITIPSASAGANLPGGTDITINLNVGDLADPGNGPGTVTGIPMTGSISGSGAVATIVFDTSQSISSVRLTSAGTGFTAGETITVPSASAGATLPGGADLEFVINSDSFLYKDVFDIETLSEGILQNSDSTESGGALQSGSADNVRWEIANVNTSSGVFSLLIRRGNDNNREKAILETWNNLSLDPKADNYIEKVIGNTTNVVLQDNGNYYIQKQGNYVNKSRYVRIKQVNYKTPDYFDNNGNAKAQYTSSMPQVQSGSFSGATGDLFPVGRAAQFYDKVNSTDIQGLQPSDYDTALKLLANTDDYKYSSIVAPGITSQNGNSVTTTLINNGSSRGDNLAIIDLVDFGAQTATVTTQAAGFDSSYGAAYWPWLQTIDPETGQQVWVPAGTMIPGVLAFTDRSSDAWFAPAGLTRGALGNVIRAERKLPTATRDTLYAANVNPIATFPQSGVVVFGQKTLQKRATALDRINVRRLLITVKSYITQIADQLVFEQNTIATRNSFLTQVNPYLETVQQRQGLYAFRVIMDESNNGPDVVDRNELVGQIFLQPTKTAEFILLDFNVTPTGASFPV
jgi:hypothetical protein